MATTLPLSIGLYVHTGQELQQLYHHLKGLKASSCPGFKRPMQAPCTPCLPWGGSRLHSERTEELSRESPERRRLYEH